MFSSAFFPPGSIPYLPDRNYYPTDTSNYPDIRNAALSLETECIDDDRPGFQCGGWRSVGARQSIGVFLWSTLSSANRRVGAAANRGLDMPGMNETVLELLNVTDVRTE